MNSASMATNLLGRPVRLKKKPEGCSGTEGAIALVDIDQEGIHFLVLMADGRLVRVENVDELTVLD